MSASVQVDGFYKRTLKAEVLRSTEAWSFNDLTLIEYWLPSGAVSERSGVGQFALHLGVAGGTRLRRQIGSRWEEADLGVDGVTMSPPGYWSRAEWSGEQRRFSLYLAPERFNAMARVDPGSFDIRGLDGDLQLDDPGILFTLKALRAKFWMGEQRGQRLAIEALATALCVDLARNHSSIQRVAHRHRQTSGGLAPWQVKRVCEAMIAAMDDGEEEATLAELALLVGLSANHFCRSFAQSTGRPPHRWMTERRIERAKALMADPRLSLTEIALAVGYTSQNTLGRAFVRVAGMTPSEWRRARLS